MSLSKRTIEMLLDLVEIKISYMDIADREDARDLQALERCRTELRALDRDTPAELVAFASAGAARRPSRRRAAM